MLDSIAAIVNDDVVLISELEERYQSYMDQVAARQVDPLQLPPKEVILNQIMERLILESVQLQEAESRGIVISDEELAEATNRYVDSVDLTIEYFQDELSKQGISFEEFRNDLRRQLLLGRIQNTVVQQRTFISLQDIQEFRDSPIFEELASEEYRIGHILLTVQNVNDSESLDEARATATKVIQELREGANFASTAVQYSSANTALEGGDLGWRKSSEIPSLFADAILELDVGETAEPIHNALGIHIIQLLEKRGASTQRGTSTHVRHILVTPSTILTTEEARLLIGDIYAQLLDGSREFEDLAKEFSDDPGSALSGGDIGWTDGSTLVPEFAAMMNQTAIGRLSPVFESDFGFHILEVLDRREEDLSEDALNNIAYQALLNRRYDETLQTWTNEIRERAFVKYIQELKQ